MIGCETVEGRAAVVYCRVSTLEQTKNLSLETQQRVCVDYCRHNGYFVAQIFVERGESAKTADRTELKKLLAYCRKHRGEIEAVIVYSISRFARDRYDHVVLRVHLQRLGVTLRSATEPFDDTSTGKLMEGVLAAFAQFDNDVRAERTRDGIRAALEAGRWPFRPPLGYLPEPAAAATATGRARRSSIVPDPEKAHLIAMAFDAYATGRHKTQRAGTCDSGRASNVEWQAAVETDAGQDPQERAIRGVGSERKMRRSDARES